MTLASTLRRSLLLQRRVVACVETRFSTYRAVHRSVSFKAIRWHPTPTFPHASVIALSSTDHRQLRCWLHTEADYHIVADEALDMILDSIDDAFDTTPIEYELTVESGVLTLSLPPHGTWVINKQTPNKQLWWSSPLSGPKRFEYDEKYKSWYSTKDGLSLGSQLVQEIRRAYPTLEEFDIPV